MFGLGFLLGRMSASNSSSTTIAHKINDKCKYSCNWWIEQTGANCSKQRMCALLMTRYFAGEVTKDTTYDGLAIFIPNSPTVIEEMKKIFQKSHEKER